LAYTRLLPRELASSTRAAASPAATGSSSPERAPSASVSRRGSALPPGFSVEAAALRCAAARVGSFAA
jgi:hypothetical protein